MRYGNLLQAVGIVLALPIMALAQSQPAAPVEPGEAGIAWYCRWDTALAEAKRSNRPIMFQSAASQCNGVPGVF